MPQVLLAAPGLLDDDTDLLHTVGAGGRAAVAVVLAAVRDSTAAERQIITVTEQGGLVTSLLPVGDLNAFGLPVEDAADMAQAIALDRDGAVDEPTPASVGDRPWDSFTDAAGALLPEYTVPRAPSGPTSIDLSVDPKSCVLPGPDELYLDAAATTAEDLAALAPAVTAETRSAVEQADPELDELVAAWFDPDAQVAKLQVLGPGHRDGPRPATGQATRLLHRDRSVPVAAPQRRVDRSVRQRLVAEQELRRYRQLPQGHGVTGARLAGRRPSHGQGVHAARRPRRRRRLPARRGTGVLRLVLPTARSRRGTRH